MDISQLAHRGGVAVYTQSLTDQLSQIKDLEMTYFYSSLRQPYKGHLKNVKKYRLPPTLFEVLFNKMRNLPIERFLGPLDVFHSSDWVQPPSRAKKVTTYHDVIPIKFPNWSHPKIVAVHKRRLQIVEREIDMVIAVSESVKKDLLEVSSIPEEKITVIYEAAGEHFKSQKKNDIDNFKKKYHLPKTYVLAVGGIGERRNLGRVRQAAKDYHLIIAGQDVPWLPYEELPLLYAGARVLLYPSLYEGFGIPIVEAMATGIPVITSNVSSMPEVGGEAAIFVNPHNLEDITQKLKMVMEDESLRKELIKKGFIQSKKFSWKKCAKETVRVYDKLVS